MLSLIAILVIGVWYIWTLNTIEKIDLEEKIQEEQEIQEAMFPGWPPQEVLDEWSAEDCARMQEEESFWAKEYYDDLVSDHYSDYECYVYDGTAWQVG